MLRTVGGREANKRWMVGLVAVALALTACGADNGGTEGPTPPDDGEPGTEAPPPEGLDALRAEAAQEGGFTWYCGADPNICEATIAGFEATYPEIRVQYLRLPSGQLATRYSEERAAGAIIGDVIAVANSIFYEQNPEWWEPLSTDVTPALADWPEEHLLLGSVARVSLQWSVLSYNTDRVAADDVPTSWEELLADEYAGGAIAFGDPRGIITFMANLMVWHDELGPEFITRLAQQDVVIADSVVPASQRMAAGEFSFVLPNLISVVEGLKAEGAPVEWTTITPVTGPQHLVAISEGARNPASARLFMNYLLTPEGQSAFNNGVGASPLGDDIEGALELPDGYIVPDWTTIADRRAELLELFQLEDV